MFSILTLPFLCNHCRQSFAYFFVYSLVQTRHAAYRRRRSAPPVDGAAASTATKMLLSAFAAAVNSCITLPLDTLSARRQAGTVGEEKGARGAQGSDDTGHVASAAADDKRDDQSGSSARLPSEYNQNEGGSSSCYPESESFQSARSSLSDEGIEVEVGVGEVSQSRS